MKIDHKYIPNETNSTLSVSNNYSTKILIVTNVDSIDSTRHGQQLIDSKAGWCCSTYKVNKVINNVY